MSIVKEIDAAAQAQIALILAEAEAKKSAALLSWQDAWVAAKATDPDYQAAETAHRNAWSARLEFEHQLRSHIRMTQQTKALLEIAERKLFENTEKLVLSSQS